MTCKNAECEMYPYYGLAPHKHNWEKLGTGTKGGGTIIESKEIWPSNFSEDPEATGCGVYYCPECIKIKKEPTQETLL